MKRGQLSDYFRGIAFKRLSAVETSREMSNQHEFNGSGPLRELLGEADRKNIPARFIWFGADQEALTSDGAISWYDARRNHPKRSEYRLYYPENPVTELMAEGDVFLLLLCKDESTLVVVTPMSGTVLNQLLWLFGLDQQPEFNFEFHEVGGNSDPQIDFAARYILDELGIEPEEPGLADLDDLIEPFGLKFPTTKTFSELARQSVTGVSPIDDPDGALIAWVDREEQLFRRLERRVVESRIKCGFVDAHNIDVDGFLSFSLSVQNRRKSRMGHALENHLEIIFAAHGLRYERGSETENGNKPDFLFPGIAQYLNPDFKEEHLIMLGAKSTLKDRWRQVLSEAKRIPRKHLLTLEPGISENQTNEMIAKQLQLVVPARLHATFRPSQQGWLLRLSDFIDAVKSTQ